MTRQINCLLIEDDIGDKNIFMRFVAVNNLDYNVIHAGGISEAFEKIDKTQFDVILADISFSDGDIYKILAHSQHIPVIVVTSEGEEEITKKVMQLGAAEYVVKDMKRNYLEVLPAAIEKSIKHKQNENLSDAFIDVLADFDSGMCIFNALGEILFATKHFRKTFGLKEGTFLINIKKLLKDVLLKDHSYSLDEIDFDTLVGTGIEFQLKMKGDTDKKKIKLIPVRDSRTLIIGYIWVEQKEFK